MHERRLWADVPKEPGELRGNPKLLPLVYSEIWPLLFLWPHPAIPHTSLIPVTLAVLFLQQFVTSSTPTLPAPLLPALGPLNLVSCPNFQTTRFVSSLSFRSISKVASCLQIFSLSSPCLLFFFSYPHLSIFCLFIHSLHCSLTLNLNVVPPPLKSKFHEGNDIISLVLCCISSTWHLDAGQRFVTWTNSYGREREEKENRGWNRQGLGYCFISFGSYSKGNKKIWEEFKQGIDLTMFALGWEWKEVEEIRWCAAWRCNKIWL